MLSHLFFHRTRSAHNLITVHATVTLTCMQLALAFTITQCLTHTQTHTQSNKRIVMLSICECGLPTASAHVLSMHLERSNACSWMSPAWSTWKVGSSPQVVGVYKQDDSELFGSIGLERWSDQTCVRYISEPQTHYSLQDIHIACLSTSGYSITVLLE